MGERIVLFGGTFNPIHLGHLRTIRSAADRLDAGRVLLVPSAQPPHKGTQDLAPGEDRLAMCRLAAEGDPRLEVSDIELRSPPPSYTIDTLHVMRRKHADAELVLVIGADMLRDFHKWRRSGEIARLARVVTLPRPGVELGRLDELRRALGDETADRMLADVLNTPLVDISSSEIRDKVRRGEPINDLVPPEVARYIAEHGLYR